MEPPPSGFDDFLGINEEEDVAIAATAEATPVADSLGIRAIQSAADPRTEASSTPGRSREGGLFDSGLLEDDDDLPEYLGEGTSSKPAPSQAKRPPAQQLRERVPTWTIDTAHVAAAAHEPLRSRLDAYKTKPLSAALPEAEPSIYDAYDDALL